VKGKGGVTELIFFAAGGGGKKKKKAEHSSPRLKRKKKGNSMRLFQHVEKKKRVGTCGSGGHGEEHGTAASPSRLMGGKQNFHSAAEGKKGTFCTRPVNPVLGGQKGGRGGQHPCSVSLVLGKENHPG